MYDHVSGIRVHTAGMCQMPDGQFVYGRSWPESRALDRAVAEQGGNRRRGVMVWAMRLHKSRGGEA